MTTTFRFSGPLDPSVALIIAAIATVIVLWVYHLETKGMSGLAKWFLPMLRAVAVVLVIFLLAGPVLETSRRIGNLGQVAIVVDRSESMHFQDARQDDSRVDRVTKLLEGESGLLQQLELTHDVTVVSSIDHGLTTDLAGMLENAASGGSFQDGDSVTERSIVLVSDGQTNTGASPLDVASGLSQSGLSISTWGFGDTEEPADLAILNVQHPDRVNASGRIRGTIDYKVAGADAYGPVEMIIRDETGVVQWRKELEQLETLDGTVDFEFPVESLKVRDSESQTAQNQDLLRLKLTAEIQSLNASSANPDDADSSNNVRPFAFWAVRSDYKILIVDGRSRWETRYLKNLFSRDPQWQTTTVIFSNEDDNDISRTTGSGKSHDDQLPASFDQLLEFDLVCFGEVEATKLEPRFLQWLGDYVSRGGGLVFIDGQRDHLQKLFADSPQQLIPVDWLGDAKPFFADRIERTSVGSSTPWLSLGSSDQQNSDQWDRLPAPRAMRLVSAAKDAEVLLEANLGSDNYPLLVKRTYGGGRILYFASDETWRWRYKRADEVHARFWNQLALALLQPPLAVGNEYAELDVENAEYESGESANVRVRLRSPDGTYNDEANVEAVLYQDEQLVQSFALQADGSLPGMYKGLSSALEPGEYRLQFIAADYGNVANQLSIDFSVSSPVTNEPLRLSQNVELLKEIASAGRGQYFAENSREDLIQYLLKRTSGRIEKTQLSLWDSYYWFVPVICLLACEWWLRKRWGLP